MCVCQFISCEIVMPRRLNCCTLSTITGLLAEVSDRCGGENFVRGPRIISLVFMKFIFILFAVAEVCNCWRNVCLCVCCEPRGRSSVKVVSSTYLWVRQSTVRSSISNRNESRLRGNLEACQRLCRPIGYPSVQSDTENLCKFRLNLAILSSHVWVTVFLVHARCIHTLIERNQSVTRSDL